MNLTTLKRISLFLAIFGLFLVYFFSPTQQAKTTIQEVRRDCSGPVAIEGTIVKVSFSSDGNTIAELRQNASKIMVFLRDGFVEEGSNLSIFGKASKFSNQCWIFPDRVEFR